MKKGIALCVMILMMLSVALPVFAEVEVEDAGIYEKFKGQNITVNVYNWGEYIADGTDGAMDVNAEFEELTGIKVVYNTFPTNEELYAKLKNGSVQYDVIIPSDYMINRMIAEDMLLPLDYGNIPNAQYVMDEFLNLEFDPRNEYSIPYTWGLVGVFYNKEVVDKEDLGSWDLLWNEKYSGEILMFSNPRDAFGIAQKLLGASFNSENKDEWDVALEKLIEQKPLVQVYVMDEIYDKMSGGEAAIGPYYCGDAKVLIEENDNIGFYFPKEGTNLFVDAMCIPSSARNKEAAELYINFMLETEVGLANTDYIGYATPNQRVYDALDDDVKRDPIYYPDEATLANTEVFQNLSPEMNEYVSQLWVNLMGTSANGNNSAWMVIVLFIVAILLVVIVVISRRRKKKREEY